MFSSLVLSLQSTLAFPSISYATLSLPVYSPLKTEKNCKISISEKAPLPEEADFTQLPRFQSPGLIPSQGLPAAEGGALFWAACCP